ncbi:MAG: M48 family metalloprotease [Armatimonadota bacterium]
MSRWKLSIIIPVILIAAAVPSFPKESKEEKMGREIAERYEEDLEFITDEQAVERVNRIGQALAKVAKAQEVPATYGESRLADYSYQFRLVENKDINAFSLPGGRIYVYSGLLDFAESDDELAGVLAHEVAHAAHHHVMALTHKQSKMSVVVALIAIAGGLGGVDSRDLANVIYGLQSVQTARLSGYGQEAEYDADRAAAIYMETAGYDPRGMIRFFDRLSRYQQETGTVRNLGIFQTHPGTDDRLMRIAHQCSEMGIPVDMREVRGLVKAETQLVTKNGVEMWAVNLAGKNLCMLANTDGSTSCERAGKVCEAVNALLKEEPGRLDISVIPEAGELRVHGKPVMSITQADCSATGLKTAQMLDHAAKVIEYAVWCDRVKTEY